MNFLLVIFLLGFIIFCHIIIVVDGNDGNQQKSWHLSLLNDSTSIGDEYDVPDDDYEYKELDMKTDSKKLPWSQPRDDCKHRYDHRFHQSSPLENFYLKKVMKKYELFHTKAINSGKIIDDLLQKDENAIVYKYIYLELDVSGLCNRLINVLWLYVFALLTNRILLVRSTSFDLNALLCQPFEYSDWIYPETKVPWETIKSLRENDRIHWKFKTFEGFHTEDIQRLVSEVNLLDHSTNSGNEESPAHHINKYQILHFKGQERYYMPLLFLNPFLHSTLHTLFPTYNVATPLVRYLIHPRNHVWNDIMSSYNHIKIMNNNNLYVGIQFRAGDNYDNQWNCIPRAGPNLWPVNTTIFPSSLFKFHIEMFINRGYENARTWNLYPKYIDLSENHEIEQQYHALHDIFLLSLSDVTILSPRSSFAYMTQALKGVSCHFPNSPVVRMCSRFLRNQESRKCYLPPSHEICYQDIMHSEKLNNLVQSAEASKFIMRCEDICQNQTRNNNEEYGLGWKLIAKSN
jgi:hypothetical protein